MHNAMDTRTKFCRNHTNLVMKVLPNKTLAAKQNSNSRLGIFLIGKPFWWWIRNQIAPKDWSKNIKYFNSTSFFGHKEHFNALSEPVKKSFFTFVASSKQHSTDKEGLAIKGSATGFRYLFKEQWSFKDKNRTTNPEPNERKLHDSTCSSSIVTTQQNKSLFQGSTNPTRPTNASPSSIYKANLCKSCHPVNYHSSTECLLTESSADKNIKSQKIALHKNGFNFGFIQRHLKE